MQLPSGNGAAVFYPGSRLTLVVNSERPNLSYTCILPAELGVPESAKNKMVFAKLEAKVAGTHSLWLVTSIELV